MKKLIPTILFVLFMAPPANALDISAPKVPEFGAKIMPENTESFPESLWELIRKAAVQISPELKIAANVSVSLICVAVMISLRHGMVTAADKTITLAGTTIMAAIMLTSTNSMFLLADETIQELSNYGKLFYPVMATALATQGCVSSSASLYAGTTLLDALLGNFITGVLLPMVYIFLAAACAGNALGEEYLKRLRDLIKNGISWLLKTVLIAFTTYMSVTGVISGTTDAATLKATKVTISSVVPVVGGILSDASEAVLVSAGLMKNAAGIYGILAIFAVFIAPFLKIGIQYLLLKATAAICSLFGSKEVSALVDDFSCALGLLLAMTGVVCLLMLISTVCFMKGVV